MLNCRFSRSGKYILSNLFAFSNLIKLLSSKLAKDGGILDHQMKKFLKILSIYINPIQFRMYITRDYID